MPAHSHTLAQRHFTTDEPTTTGAESATSLADDRVGYVPAGPRTAAQVPEEALAHTVTGLSGVIRSATFDPNLSDVPSADGIGLRVEVSSDGPSPVQQMEGDWEAALLVGAVADRTAADGHWPQ